MVSSIALNAQAAVLRRFLAGPKYIGHSDYWNGLNWMGRQQQIISVLIDLPNIFST